MECAAKGSGRTRCTGAATRPCARCGAVAYCSLSHQIEHWSSHKHECDRLEQQMESVHLLNDFPFTFSQEATVQIFLKQETRCSFLSKRGIHQKGMWMIECRCGESSASFDCLRLNNSWDLPRNLYPCYAPESQIPVQLHSWSDYYNWRCIPLDSPAALLLHWPLTIYHAAQLVGIGTLNPEVCDKLYLHYLGPEKELLQLDVFGELQALFPGVHIHIELVGPAIPPQRDGEKISISRYASSNEDQSTCKSASENAILSTQSGITSAVTLQLWHGLYHDRYRDIVKELIEKLDVPAVFTDYCEEACHLAASCIENVINRSFRLPVQVNPFRQPIAVEDSVLLLPCYSNCFVFGM
ncbi:uncharacterized protein LOC107489029 isoform X3 [Arachis duranensis]|uniref:Uncharacterized protein LOC107489029 isoform X3 n=1 Tax=Arachis duranensis TaxID=130453 RepID=A0A6P5NKG3_ARADU|nr:uncharacterized protein LOC107489029 isoform X3 [Arachis duranensis]